MDSMFFGDHWYYPKRSRYSPSFRFPTQPVQPRATTTTPPAPEVVPIPVRFVGSESSRSASALKIQKVFRGFLVRNSMKKITAIRREVEEIERRICQSETGDLIRRDEREWVSVIETLMALLFKLDCIRGIDSGVRECRRAVIKKAIGLQERVDAIIAAAPSSDETLSPKSEEQAAARETADAYSNQTTETEVLENHTILFESDADQTGGRALDAITDCDDADNKIVEIESVGDLENSRREGEPGNLKRAVENCDPDHFPGDCRREAASTDESEQWLVVGNSTEEEEVNSTEKEGSEEEKLKREARERDEDKGNRELLKRMVEDNEKLMSMMVQLFEKNETQTSMLKSLSRRVEQLERAFLCDLLRKKKKKDASK